MDQVSNVRNTLAMKRPILGGSENIVWVFIEWEYFLSLVLMLWLREESIVGVSKCVSRTLHKTLLAFHLVSARWKGRERKVPFFVVFRVSLFLVKWWQRVFCLHSYFPYLPRPPLHEFFTTFSTEESLSLFLYICMWTILRTNLLYGCVCVCVLHTLFY